MKSQKIFGKKELNFTVLRYIVFFLQGVRTSVVAYFLGPYYLGIYGFIMLYIQYLSYTNLGIQYSLNSEISILKSNDIAEKKKLINSGFTGIFFNSIILILSGILIFFYKVKLFPIEDSFKYIFVIILLTIFNHFQKIFVTIFRIEKKLEIIIKGEFIIGASLFAIAFLFDGLNLINALFYGWTVLLLVVLIYFKRSYQPKIIFDLSRIKLLLKSGLPQLLHVFSYYLMTLMTKTLAATYYPVEVLGYITFGISATVAIMLGLDTITWLIFPSMINKLSDKSLKGDELTNYVVLFSNKLILAVISIISVCILFLPLLFQILSDYKPVHFTLIVLLINQIIFNAGFILISLCISRKMYIQIAAISFTGAALSTMLSIIFSILDLPFIWLVISNFLGSLVVFNMLLYFVSLKFKLNLSTLKKFFNWNIQLIFISIILFTIIESYLLIFLAFLSIYILKRKDFINLFKDFLKIIKI